MSSPRSVCYEVHEGAEGLAGLRVAWEALEEQGADHIFQTYAHADMWQRTVGTPSGAKPLLISLREGDRIVGIFPACRVRENGVPLLTWLGAPRILDYGDVIFDPAAAETSVDDFVAQSLRLISRNARGAFLYLMNVREDARAFGPLDSRLRTLRDTTAPFIPIEGTWQDYLAGRSGRLRSNFNRLQRRLYQRGNVEFEILAAGDPRIASAVARLVVFQRQRFAALGSRTPLVQQRYVDFRTQQATEGLACVATLRLDGECIAVALQIVFRGRVYLLADGFDQDYADCAPGLLLQGFIVRSCFENGWDPCDLGWGDEAYKYHWTDRDVKLTTFVGTGVAGSALAAGASTRRWIARAIGSSQKKSPAPSGPKG